MERLRKTGMGGLSKISGRADRADSEDMVRPAGRGSSPQCIDLAGHFGAGDGIRTHDPNLGKVVLYP